MDDAINLTVTHWTDSDTWAVHAVVLWVILFRTCTYCTTCSACTVYVRCSHIYNIMWLQRTYTVHALQYYICGCNVHILYMHYKLYMSCSEQNHHTTGPEHLMPTVKKKTVSLYSSTMYYLQMQHVHVCGNKRLVWCSRCGLKPLRDTYMLCIHCVPPPILVLSLYFLYRVSLCNP